MSDSAVRFAAAHATQIAEQFTQRPMTPSEARDLADMIRCSTVLEPAADVVDAWNAADEPGRNLVRRYMPKLGAALDAMAKEDRA